MSAKWFETSCPETSQAASTTNSSTTVRAQGTGYQTRMNAVLRSYMDATVKRAGRRKQRP